MLISEIVACLLKRWKAGGVIIKKPRPSQGRNAVFYTVSYNDQLLLRRKIDILTLVTHCEEITLAAGSFHSPPKILIIPAL